MAMRTVLVTGGAGFIGSHLVDQLLDGGASVRVLDNLSTGSLGNLQPAADRHSRSGGASSGSRLEVIIGDVRDRVLLRKALRGVKYVFHLAALPTSGAAIADIANIHSVNVEGTLNVLHGALTEGVWRVVFGSCSSVYGAVDSVPVSEEAPLRPTSLFGASKVAAETYCRAFHVRHHLDTVTLRYFSVYGPRQKGGPGGSLVPNLVEALRERRRFEDQDERSGEDFTYVDDAVAATLAAGRAPRAGGRVINVGSGQLVRIGDVIHILAGLMKADAVPRLWGTVESQPSLIFADTSAAAELLDFAPRISLIAGLARMVDAMEEGQIERAALAPVGLDD
jgi:nucleoside-diphosphate-sugar epimerase